MIRAYKAIQRYFRLRAERRRQERIDAGYKSAVKMLSEGFTTVTLRFLVEEARDFGDHGPWDEGIMKAVREHEEVACQ